MTVTLCEHLEWDSTFFARRIARVTAHRLTEAEAEAAVAWCAAEHVDCLYVLADSDDATTVRALERRGFAFVDVRLTLTRIATGPAPPVAGIRPARADDTGVLQEIARNNHSDSRFYYDGHFPRERCDALYATWLARSVEGYADAVLVAEHEGAVVGYITCLLGPSGAATKRSGSIGLLGIAKSAAGLGLGGALIDAALAWFEAHGITEVEVVTQGRNVRAQRAYQRHGFVSKAMQLWFHRWFEGPSGSDGDANRLRTA